MLLLSLIPVILGCAAVLPGDQTRPNGRSQPIGLVVGPVTRVL